MASNPGAYEVNSDLATIEIHGQWRTIKQVLSHKASGSDSGLSGRMWCSPCSIVSQSRSCHTLARRRASCVELCGIVASAAIPQQSSIVPPGPFLVGGHQTIMARIKKGNPIQVEKRLRANREKVKARLAGQQTTNR